MMKKFPKKLGKPFKSKVFLNLKNKFSKEAKKVLGILENIDYKTKNFKIKPLTEYTTPLEPLKDRLPYFKQPVGTKYEINVK